MQALPSWSFFFFSSRRRHTRLQGDWSSDVCSSDLGPRIRRQGSEEKDSGYGYTLCHFDHRGQAGGYQGKKKPDSRPRPTSDQGRLAMDVRASSRGRPNVPNADESPSAVPLLLTLAPSDTLLPLARPTRPPRK